MVAVEVATAAADVVTNGEHGTCERSISVGNTKGTNGERTVSSVRNVITHSLDVFLRKHFVRSRCELTIVHAIDSFSTRFHRVFRSMFTKVNISFMY